MVQHLFQFITELGETSAEGRVDVIYFQAP